MPNITQLPITITQPGTYVLQSDLVTSGNGIVIQSDNVTIDLNGFTITGSSDASTQAFGISAFDYSNITISNGSIDGFFYGIYLSDIVASKSSEADFDDGNHLIDNVTITNSTFRGIRVEGLDNVVSNNLIQNIGGTSVYENPYAFGIESFGPDALIENNVIEEIRGGGEADIGEGVGISLSYFVSGSIIRGNAVRNDMSEVDGGFPSWPAESRSTWGIWVGGFTDNVLIEDNTVENFLYGITFKRTAVGFLQDNTVMGAITPFYLPFNEIGGGWDLGGNVGDIPSDEFVLRRNNPGNFEFVEQVYMSPLHRSESDGIIFTPIWDPTAGDDIINGVVGREDMVDYWGSANPVFVDLEAGTATVSDAGGPLSVDQLISIEGAQGSAGDDLLVGDGQNNLLAGAEGDDILVGAGGNDYLFGDRNSDQLFGNEGVDLLFGGHGNDILAGGAGADHLDGGDNFDLAAYDDENFGNLIVSLSDTSINTGAAVGDVFIDIEGLLLGDGNDRAYGDAEDNSIFGGAGHDFLFGGLGADFLDGGNGFDYVSFNDANYGDISASLGDQSINTNAAAGDVYVGIEGLILGAGNDHGYGDAGDNYLYGMTGADNLYGGFGSDFLHGGAGIDYARYDDQDYGNLIVSMANAAQSTGAAAGDQFVEIEGIITGTGNDRIIGNSEDNFLIAADGNDMLSGGAGADTHYGGSGLDYARYDDAAHGDLTVSLINTHINTGVAIGDIFIGIEGLVLGFGNDTGQGGAGSDYMYGMSGNDLLNGQSGHDRLNGGAGIDRLVGGRGDDRLTGGADNDTFVFRANYDNDEIWDYSGVGLAGGENDRIDVRGVFADFGAVDAATAQVGNNVEITVNANDSLTLLNYQKSDLVDGDFIF